MRYLTTIISVSLIVITVISCGEEEAPLPPPNAAFSTNTGFSPFILGGHGAEPDDVIFFTNNSNNASTYLWDFGDGTTSTEKHPAHAYPERGEYEIVLIAKNDNDEFSVANGKIIIGVRSFAGITLSKINTKRPNGEPWDSNSPPDILFLMGEVNNPANSIFLSLPANFPIDQLPVSGAFSLDTDVVFTDSDWFFILIDNDEPMESFDENDEYMFGDVLNPTEVGQLNLTEESGGSFFIQTGQDAFGNQTTEFIMKIKWVLIP